MNATSNFQLGKLLPEKIGLSLPVYMSYNQVRKDQKYNPLDTDIKINQLKNGSYKSYLLDVTPDQQTSRSINFSNVKKLKKAKKKKRLYDISNFDATFAYNENEKKREIYLLKPSFFQSFVDDFRRKNLYKKDANYISQRLKKTG